MVLRCSQRGKDTEHSIALPGWLLAVPVVVRVYVAPDLV
jgi:hypothetical protein